MEKDITQEMFDFIKINTPNLDDVIAVKLLDDDGEYGSIGEFYIVKCLLAVPNYSVQINNLFDKTEKTCLVNSKAFKRWLSQKNSITWI